MSLTTRCLSSHCPKHAGDAAGWYMIYPDGKSLSHAAGNAGGESGGRDVVATGYIDGAF